jgi:hypothetical protein
MTVTGEDTDMGYRNKIDEGWEGGNHKLVAWPQLQAWGKVAPARGKMWGPLMELSRSSPCLSQGRNRGSCVRGAAVGGQRVQLVHYDGNPDTQVPATKPLYCLQRSLGINAGDDDLRMGAHNIKMIMLLEAACITKFRST